MYTEFNENGWPLCPRCGNDELYSMLMLAWFGEGERPTLADCMAGEMRCYACQFSSSGDALTRELERLRATESATGGLISFPKVSH